MFRKVVIAMWLIPLCFAGYSQDNSELSYAEQLEQLEMELDSLSIFNLLDSVLLLMDSSSQSELNLRLGFTSSVTSAGRDYNINQSGLSPGISFYHKSGAYADLTGYWNSNVSPNYNPTILSGGYLGTISPKWSYSLDYEHWFYNPRDSSDNNLTNSLGSSLSYDFKKGYASADYTFLFGGATSHRIIGSVTGVINLGEWRIFKEVTLFPTASIMFGNGDVTQLFITNQQISNERQQQISLLDTLANLPPEGRRFLAQLVQLAFENGEITQLERNGLLSALVTASLLTEDQLALLNQLASDGFDVEEFVDSNEFGLLNYSFTLPLSLSTDRVSLLFSYTYSIPVKLPGEIFDIDPIGYFGISISYRIPFD